MIKAASKYFIREAVGRLPSKVKKYIHSASGDVQTNDKRGLISKAHEQIKRSIVASNLGDFAEAERRLREAAILDPTNPDIAPHLGRVRFLNSRADDLIAKEQTRAMHHMLGSMRREIESKPIYAPSTYWDTNERYHVKLLERYGIENFKRTVSHDYQNWHMVDHDDPQVRQLYKTWALHFRVEPWFNTMEVPNHVGYHLSMDFEDPVNPLASFEQREIYRIAVGLLWEFVDHMDKFHILKKLNESEIGNPYRIWRKGQLISSDLAHSARERNMLLEALSLKGDEALTVAELGGGHGRLAEIFGRTTNFRYCIFDITPALYISQWYIKALFPQEKIFEFRHFDSFDEIRDELEQSRFAFFTANQIEKIPPDAFHLFINMNSLGEMQTEQIDNFLYHIDRLATLAFLSRQYIKWTNDREPVSVTKDSFAMNNRWRLILDKVDDIHPHFFNQIWKR